VETHEQVVKCLLVGADAVMTTSALLRHGVGHVRSLVDGLEAWLGEHQLGSVRALRELRDAPPAENTAADLRAQYVKALTGYGFNGPRA
jgi:dihydroorotate dehydrogenase (fumarate)